MEAWAKKLGATRVIWKGVALYAMTGQLVVDFRPGTPQPVRDAAVEKHGLTIINRSEFLDSYLTQVPSGADLESVANTVMKEPVVEKAFPNIITNPP